MKVGDYVRTKNKAPFEPSQIAKITDMKKDEGYKNQYFITLDHNLPTTYNFHIYSEDVIKSSSNIIDLIEVGDVLVVKDFADEACMIFTDIYLIQNEQQLINIKSDLEKNKNKKLYSIVTSEQFSQMEYITGIQKK